MRFITFQPWKVVESLDSTGIYNAPKNKKLKDKIYCLKVDENTMGRIFMCAPSMPQVAIIFETDDYEELDSVAWVNEISLGLKIDSTSKYKEYTVNKISKDEVLEYITISKSEDPDEVQDDFMDTHFKELEKLSGHKWYRLCEREDLVGSAEADELMFHIHLCMMPFMPVTEKDYDKWAELIRRNFIKK